MVHEAGKGDKRRPGQNYQDNWDKIDWSKNRYGNEIKPRGGGCPCEPLGLDGLICPCPKTNKLLCE